MDELITENEALPKILVVDDEEIICNLLFDTLSPIGYQVKTAINGNAAINQIENESFEIIITDLKMPGISGLELLQHVRKINPDICVVVTTAYGTIESAVSAMKLGAYDYICKPFELEEMKIVVTRAVEWQRLLRKSRLVEMYKRLSIIDGLTGVYNHRYFHEFLDLELQRAEKNSRICCLIFADVDDFKKYNDLNGHLAGDEILRELAAIILSTTRKSDVVARYGGEEFAVVLPDTAMSGGLCVARKIMKETRDKKWMYAGIYPDEKISLSVGVVAYPADALAKEDLIRKADNAMYSAKKNGKNRICYYEETQILEYKEG